MSSTAVVNPVALEAAANLFSPTPPAGAGTSATQFGDWVTREIASTNQAVLAAEEGLRRVALGDQRNLHQVAIQMEQARLSFQLLTQVRTRALEAYQEVMRMQV